MLLPFIGCSQCRLVHYLPVADAVDGYRRSSGGGKEAFKGSVSKKSMIMP